MTGTLEAATGLHARLRGEPWYIVTGQGDGRIVVYVDRMPAGRDRAKVPDSFGGYPVGIEYARKGGQHA